MTNKTSTQAGDATAAFVSWLVTGAVGPALVALPVNLAADKLSAAAVRWLKRLRQTDDLSRLVKAATGTSVQLSRDEVRELRTLLESEQTWRLLASGRLREKLLELTAKVAGCLPPRDGRTTEDAREAASVIARGLVEFAVFELQPETFQRVVLSRLQQMSDEASALDAALFHMHADLYRLTGEAKDLFRLVSDRLPPGPADLGEIKIYLRALINWLNCDPWPQDQRLGGPVLTPAAIERKLRFSDARGSQEQDADELARECSRLVILGAPGSGKTWLAMRTARICAEAAVKGLEGGAALDDVELPLYTTCSRLIATSGGIREAAVSGTLNWMGDLGGSRIVNALRLFLAERTDQPTLLVIDSLDEASDANNARERLRQADSLKQPWRIVVTTRPSSWNNQLKIDKENKAHQVGELQPLRYPDDVESVIGNWFAENPARGRILSAQISRRPSLQQAATVPLVLAFYCILSGGQHPLPESRHKLYEQVLNRMLRSPWHSGSALLRDAAGCRNALRSWAWQAAKTQKHPVSGIGQWEDDILAEDAELSAGGQVAVDHVAAPQGPPDFDTDQTRRRFVHRSIREYLVAAKIASLPAEQAAQELLFHLWYDPDWEYAAPAGLAMHPQRGHILMDLLSRVTGDADPRTGIATVDGCHQLRWFLIQVANESAEDDWPPEAADIIGWARTDLAASRPGNILQITNPHWPTSSRVIFRSVLSLLAEPARIGTRISPVLEKAVTQLAVTGKDRANVRKMLLSLLATNTHPYPEARGLVQTLVALDPTAEDRAQAWDTLLIRLASDVSYRMAHCFMDAIALLNPSAEARSHARDTLLASLIRQSNDTNASLLAEAVSKLDPTVEDQAQARDALVRLLGSGTAGRTAAMIAGLAPSAEDLSRAREILLRRLADETGKRHPSLDGIPDLVKALVELDATATDRIQAYEVLHRLLIDNRRSHGVALKHADALALLTVHEEDRKRTRATLLSLLATATGCWAAEELMEALAKLNPAPGERAQAWKLLLKILASNVNPMSSRTLVHLTTVLDPAAEDRPWVREALLGMLAAETDPRCAGDIARAASRLDPTCEEQTRLRDALLSLLAVETDSILAPDLAKEIAQLGPTDDERARARVALLGLLPRQSELEAAIRVAQAMTRLNPAPEDRGQALSVLLGLIASELDLHDFPPPLAEAVADLAVTGEEMALARKALLGLLDNDYADGDAYVSLLLVDQLLRLDPTEEDRNHARAQLVRRLSREAELHAASELAALIARLNPGLADIADMNSWRLPPPAILLAAVRQNSRTADWLAALPQVRAIRGIPLDGDW
jgi:tetratricopeptide (TPR) repeat protein